MSRLDRLVPQALDEEQRKLYVEITEGPRATGPQHFELTDQTGGLNGPFNAFLLSPRVGGALQRLGAALRYETALSPRTRELAILLVAAHWNSEFEWYAHERVGRAVGVTSEELERIRSGETLTLPDPGEASAMLVVHHLLHGDLPDDVYAAAAAEIGEPLLFELSTLVGYYAGLALQMRVFRVTD